MIDDYFLWNFQLFVHKIAAKRVDTAKNPTNAVVKLASMAKNVINVIHIRAAKMVHVNDHGNVTASKVNGQQRKCVNQESQA